MDISGMDRHKMYQLVGAQGKRIPEASTYIQKNPRPVNMTLLLHKTNQISNTECFTILPECT
jgi:hypothetical protein